MAKIIIVFTDFQPNELLKLLVSFSWESEVKYREERKKYMIIHVRNLFCIAVLFGTSHSKNIVKYQLHQYQNSPGIKLMWTKFHKK